MRRHALIAALLLAPAAVLAQPAPPAVPVGVVAATKQQVTPGVEFVGRVEAMQKVDVQARVSGYLLAVDFTEGGTVKEGDRLYVIDPAPFQAALQQARGTLLQAQAQLTNARLQRNRAEELVKTSATSVATRDQRVAQEQTAQGQARNRRVEVDVQTHDGNVVNNLEAGQTREAAPKVTKGKAKHKHK